MLLEEGAAIQVHAYDLLPFRLDPVFADKDRLRTFQRRSRDIGNPDAARRIAHYVARENFFEKQPVAANVCVDDVDGKEGSSPRHRKPSSASSFAPSISETPSMTPSISPLTWFDPH